MNQISIFDDPTDPLNPAAVFDKDAAKRSLDDLFVNTCQYKTGDKYHALLNFVVRFKRYAPFNAMLIHIQKPGAKYALSPSQWMREFERTIKPSGQPIMILKTMGPVMFVFDVSDTEGRSTLPPEIVAPFEVHAGRIGGEYECLMDNCARDGIRITIVAHGSQNAGSIQRNTVKSLTIPFRPLVTKDAIQIPLRYDMLISDHMSREARFATLVHELAHLYCGHLGTPNERWWPDRRGLDVPTREFEAESVAHLVCKRFSVDPASHKYLSGYLKEGTVVPNISLDRVMVSAGLIEAMCKQRMKMRKTNED